MRSPPKSAKRALDVSMRWGNYSSASRIAWRKEWTTPNRCNDDSLNPSGKTWGSLSKKNQLQNELPRNSQDLANLYMEHRQERRFEKHLFLTLLGDRLPPTIEEEDGEEEEEEEKEEEEEEHQLELLLEERPYPTIEEKDEDEEKEKEEEEKMGAQQGKHQFETLLENRLPPTKVTIEEEDEGEEKENEEEGEILVEEE